VEIKKLFSNLHKVCLRSVHNIQRYGGRQLCSRYDG